MSKDLRNRILITITLLVLVQIISYIPIPLINIKYVFQSFNSEESPLTFLATLKRFSVSALGILPYLSASMLVMTILYLFRFRKGINENKYPLHLCTIVLTIIIIIVQSIGLARFYQCFPVSSEGGVLVKTGGIFFTLGVIVSLSGGTLIIVWIAHIISVRGIGNGLIMIIGLNLLNHCVPSILNLLKNAQLDVAEKFFPLLLVAALLIFIFVNILLLLSTWTYELKLSTGQQANRQFLLKFPLLLIGIFPIFFVPNFNYIFRLFNIEWFGLPPVTIAIDFIFIVLFAFIWTLIVYQPKRLQQMKARFSPDSLFDNEENAFAFDKKLIRIFVMYSISMLFICGMALILEAWLKARVNIDDFQLVAVLLDLLVLIVIIIDVYYQIRTHREMHKFHTASKNHSEPLFCEECNEKVTSDDKYCRYCGANFAEGISCVHHPEKPAEYQCVVCLKPLCCECSISIKNSHRCTDHEFVEIREGWSKIQLATTFVEAQFIQEFLKKNDMTSMILSNVMGSNYGAIKLWQLTPVIPFMVARWLGGGEIKIFVPAEDFQHSWKLLEAHLSNEI